MNDISPAQELAMLANDCSEQPKPLSMKPISLRIPYSVTAQIDAIGSVTGVQSRNALIVSLVRAGIHAVISELDDVEQYEAAHEFFKNQYDLLQEVQE